MKKWMSLSIVALLLTGCEKLDAEVAKLKRIQEEPVIQVKTVDAYIVEENKDGQKLEVSGVVTPRQELSLSFGASGKIADILVQKGAVVKAGQTLATLDETVLQQGVTAAQGQVDSANIRRSKAMQGPQTHEVQAKKLQVEKAQQTAARAKQDYEQAKVLYANGAIAKDELDRLALADRQAQLDLQEEKVAYDQLLKGADRLDVEEANASVQQANVQLSRARQEVSEAVLKAPFAGVVAAIAKVKAEQTGAGSEVIRLVDTSQWLVNLQVDSDQIVSWKPGSTVTVSASDGSQAEGKVTFVSPVMDQTTGAYPVEVTVAGSEVNWKGGMTVTCQYQISDKKVLLVPVSSVGVVENEYYVMKITENNSLEKTVVKVGALHGSNYEVLEGLSQGDQIVRSGLSYVVDGEAVKVADE